MDIREEIARKLFRITHPFEEMIEEAYYPKWKDDVDQILSIKVGNYTLKELIERETTWVDKPNKGGDYWLSPFINGKHISPRIIEVIDYEDGRLDVHDCNYIPVDIYIKEYYPKAKYLYIPIPNWIKEK